MRPKKQPAAEHESIIFGDNRIIQCNNTNPDFTGSTFQISAQDKRTECLACGKVVEFEDPIKA